MKSVGEYNIVRGNLDIHYQVEDSSFSHEFGIQKQTTWKVKSVQYYITEVGRWIDAEPIEAKCFSLHEHIKKLIQLDFEQGD